MKLPSPSPHLSLPKASSPLTQAKSEKNVQEAGQSIGTTFEAMLQDVNQAQLNAEAKQVELVTSTNKDIHGTMIAMEKAEISFRLMMQVRNKMVDAYEEIMRMQV